MESFRQIITATYHAMGTAAGEEVLTLANAMLQDALDAGSINDPYARNVIEQLIRTTSEA